MHKYLKYIASKIIKVVFLYKLFRHRNWLISFYHLSQLFHVVYFFKIYSVKIYLNTEYLSNLKFALPIFSHKNCANTCSEKSPYPSSLCLKFSSIYLTIFQWLWQSLPHCHCSTIQYCHCDQSDHLHFGTQELHVDQAGLLSLKWRLN